MALRRHRDNLAILRHHRNTLALVGGVAVAIAVLPVPAVVALAAAILVFRRTRSAAALRWLTVFCCLYLSLPLPLGGFHLIYWDPPAAMPDRIHRLYANIALVRMGEPPLPGRARQIRMGVNDQFLYTRDVLVRFRAPREDVERLAQRAGRSLLRQFVIEPGADVPFGWATGLHSDPDYRALRAIRRGTLWRDDVPYGMFSEHHELAFDEETGIAYYRYFNVGD